MLPVYSVARKGVIPRLQDSKHGGFQAEQGALCAKMILILHV